MNDLTRYVCVFPSVVVSLACVVVGLVFSVGGMMPPRTEDDRAVVGFGVVLFVFGVVVLAALGLVYAMSRMG